MLLHKYSSLALAVVCLLLLAIIARAQDKDQPVEVIPYPPLVRLNVLVTNSSNHPVTDLRAEEFHVLEDGKPQNIMYFSREELPISYGLVVDSSGSMRALLGHVIEAGKKIIESNKPGDETFLLSFVDAKRIQVEQDFTSNKYALSDALDSIYIEGGLTALIDAINRSIDYLKKNKRSNNDARRRQVIILITDGEDRGSRSRNQELLLNRLREEDVQFFIIGLSKLASLQSSAERAVDFLKRIAAASGGRAVFPESTAEIPGAVEEIVRDLRTQYVISYTPTNKAYDGSFRTIQVTVPDSPTRNHLNVITKPGYIATPRMLK
ncbi:MAG TPA: VWA domain-containing protein [Pyrinomonadaceae bacterium]|nr:VWA domain-containing protein [Pyrinomonadaceae bacterium]